MLVAYFFSSGKCCKFVKRNGIICFGLENSVIPSICFEIATSLKLLAMTYQNKCVGISTL